MITAIFASNAALASLYSTCAFCAASSIADLAVSGIDPTRLGVGIPGSPNVAPICLVIEVLSVVLNPIEGSAIAPGVPPANAAIEDCNCATAPTGSPTEAKAVRPPNLLAASPNAPVSFPAAPLIAPEAPPNAPDTLPNLPATEDNAPVAAEIEDRPFIAALDADLIAPDNSLVPGIALIAPAA